MNYNNLLNRIVDELCKLNHQNKLIENTTNHCFFIIKEAPLKDYIQNRNRYYIGRIFFSIK